MRVCPYVVKKERGFGGVRKATQGYFDPLHRKGGDRSTRPTVWKKLIARDDLHFVRERREGERGR